MGDYQPSSRPEGCAYLGCLLICIGPALFVAAVLAWSVLDWATH